MWLEARRKFSCALRQAVFASCSFFLCVEPSAHPKEELVWSASGKFDGFSLYADKSMVSPKSAAFSGDGSVLWVNALEAGKTLAFDVSGKRKLWEAGHCFDKADALRHAEMSKRVHPPFDQPKIPLGWCGKPVEMAFSPDGKTLWVSSYRKSFDANASMSSSVTALSAMTGERVGSLPSGPIPKMLATSPDGKMLAVTNWGDNTMDVWDISSGPGSASLKWRVVVGGQLPKSDMFGDRDKNCGLCLRGTVFSPDSGILLVARMSGNARIDVVSSKTGELAGWLKSPGFPVRHLSSDGKWLYATSTKGAFVARAKWSDVIGVSSPIGGELHWEKIGLGGAARTVSVGGGMAVVAVHGKGEVVLLRAGEERGDFEVVWRGKAPLYPVGAAMSGDGKRFAVTSQGVDGKEGHKVAVWSR